MCLAFRSHFPSLFRNIFVLCPYPISYRGTSQSLISIPIHLPTSILISTADSVYYMSHNSSNIKFNLSKFSTPIQTSLTQLCISHLLGFIPPSQLDIPKLLEHRPRSHFNVPPPTFPLTSSFRPLVRLLLLNAEDTRCMTYRLQVLFLRKNLCTSDLSSKSATLFHFPPL